MTTASATTMDMGTDYTAEDVKLGAKIIGWALSAIGAAISLAIAACFTAWWSMLIAFIISILVAGLLQTIAAIGIVMVVDDSTFAAIGKGAFNVQSTVTGWFSSKK